jgi:hypothetical protein
LKLLNPSNKKLKPGNIQDPYISINQFNSYLISTPYHIVLQRKKQVLLSFLKIRAIVNGNEIYPLATTKPVVITVDKNNPRVVVTDGFHYTKPLKLVFKELPVYCFKVVCAISDERLLAGTIVWAGIYISGFITGALVLKIFSFIPIIYLILFYYLNRDEFIRLEPVLD